jgi:hypothetical protein
MHASATRHHLQLLAALRLIPGNSIRGKKAFIADLRVGPEEKEPPLTAGRQGVDQGLQSLTCADSLQVRTIPKAFLGLGELWRTGLVVGQQELLIDPVDTIRPKRCRAWGQSGRGDGQLAVDLDR